MRRLYLGDHSIHKKRLIVNQAFLYASELLAWIMAWWIGVS